MLKYIVCTGLFPVSNHVIVDNCAAAVALLIVFRTDPSVYIATRSPAVRFSQAVNSFIFINSLVNVPVTLLSTAL